MRETPVWFLSFCACEIFVQLPFFFVAAFGFLRGRNWMRVPILIYGTHVATTVLPMLADFLLSPKAKGNGPLLAAMYAPYFLLPAAMVVRMAAAGPQPFGPQGKGGKAQ